MRPGPFPWAEDDLYTGGPDIGSPTKTAPLAAHRGDGYYRTRRPAPDILNWQLNRAHLLQKSVARMQVMNWYETGLLPATLAGYTLESACHYQDVVNTDTFINAFLYDNGPDLVDEIYRGQSQLVGWTLVPGPCNPVSNLVNAITVIDSDADDINMRMVAIYGNVADLVRYNNAYIAAWGDAPIPAAPGLLWRALGNDRNTVGPAVNARWLIGDDGTGPGAVSRLYTSNGGNPPSFVNVGGWPVIAEPIRFIGHTCHRAGALGTDDPGNPSWLILTTTQACRSADGLTWNQAAHGFPGNAPEKKTAAYSRTSGRWVSVMNGVAAGVVMYSDDLGATWTTIATALVPPPGGGNPLEIACDGHGTFVISEINGHIWVSVDDGLTWTYLWAAEVMTANANLIEPFYGVVDNVDDTPAFPAGFVLLDHDGGGIFHAYRSLVL